MKGVKIFAVCAALFLLERVFFTRFEIFSLTPWLMFSFCAAASAVQEELGWWTLCAGICGLAGDLAGGAAPGTGMAVYALGAAGINVCARFFHESLPLTAVIVFLFSIAAEFLYCLLNYGAEIAGTDGLMISVILPLAVLNMVCSVIFYPIAKRLFTERRRTL